MGIGYRIVTVCISTLKYQDIKEGRREKAFTTKIINYQDIDNRYLVHTFKVSVDI